ncbi:Type II secretion system protein [Halorhabdus tiamatea SARL4B]|uniref:Type II secretion system protein n=1 Tax=Halorhabdus tiamatea SARL4B TaxID=1033806 RepID=F7PIC2_9EURY|nr:type II/IV secretion system ATPase subunit [Halorhabdus tiamatea]ERJ05227.1 Type II secretion system protein [Halorhabdus tiamatea SARL4B]CCQ34868.1 type II secretion system, protein E [Halorhabdus tiamatea SARL4B]
MAIDDESGGGDTIRSRATSLFGDSDDEQTNEGGDEAAYDWVDFRREFHDGGAFDRSEYLGFDPHRTAAILQEHASDAKTLNTHWQDFVDPETTPVVRGTYLWEHFKQEYYYEPDGSVPRDDEGEQIDFEKRDHLGFEPDEIEGRLSHGQNLADELADFVDERTVDVNEDLDEDAFFSTVEGHTTVVNRYDLERAVPMEKKLHFEEVERYWVNKPYACVILFHSKKENERKYYVIEPALNDIERELKDFLGNKLKTAIKYAEEGVSVEDGEVDRAGVIEREAQDLLARYDIYEEPIQTDAGMGSTEWLKGLVGMDTETDAIEPVAESNGLDGISARPEPAILADDPDTLNEYQVEKLLYFLKRDYIGYSKIDPIKHDINVEDISCDGYNSRVFAYHTDYEQTITNVEHGESDLDDFVVKLAQRSGKGISKRQPQVDATLPDGSRAQLTLGREVSDHGTNYTIRQFKDVPFTPVDLINWNTFSLDEMAFLWLAIENNKSMIFAGGTASGKTTSLNAISLFIPSNAKIVSIEDTREVELPQRNWVASVTRPSFGEDQTGDIDEFDLLEAALRQRPDYIVMGEVRGEEGRDLFQVMSTGHTGYSTFHADTVGEVIKRFTTDPINVSKTLFTALDLVSIQTQTRVQGRKVRRNKTLTEINEYSPENDEINVRDVYQWQAESDEFLQMGSSSTLEEIKFDRGWDQDTLDEELFMRKVVLAYLIEQGLNTYTEVAATLQAFINDPKTIMTLIANDQLAHSLEDLREMESVQIEVDPEKEEMVPRPDPPDELLTEAEDVLENATPLFDRYKDQARSDIVSALADDGVDEGDDETVDFGRFVPKAGSDGVEEA